MRRKRYVNDDIEIKEKEDYYTVEKILDEKVQGGKRFYLVKWLNWDVKTCSWEEEGEIEHLKALIKEFRNSRKFDRQNNLGLKQFDWVEPGLSPYEATKFYGHFLYGDEPLKIESVQVVQKNEKKQLHFQVEWKSRENGFKPTNSLIESKMLLEHAPGFLVGFYQEHTHLIVSEK